MFLITESIVYYPLSTTVTVSTDLVTRDIWGQQSDTTFQENI